MPEQNKSAEKKSAAKPKAAAKTEYATKSSHDKLRAEFNEFKAQVAQSLNVSFD